MGGKRNLSNLHLVAWETFEAKMDMCELRKNMRFSAFTSMMPGYKLKKQPESLIVPNMEHGCLYRILKSKLPKTGTKLIDGRRTPS